MHIRTSNFDWKIYLYSVNILNFEFLLIQVSAAYTSTGKDEVTCPGAIGDATAAGTTGKRFLNNHSLFWILAISFSLSLTFLILFLILTFYSRIYSNFNFSSLISQLSYPDGAGDFTFVQGTNVSSGNANTFFNRLGAILSRPSEEQVCDISPYIWILMPLPSLLSSRVCSGPVRERSRFSSTQERSKNPRNGRQTSFRFKCSALEISGYSVSLRNSLPWQDVVCATLSAIVFWHPGRGIKILLLWSAVYPMSTVNMWRPMRSMAIRDTKDRQPYLGPIPSQRTNR